VRELKISLKMCSFESIITTLFSKYLIYKMKINEYMSAAKFLEI